MKKLLIKIFITISISFFILPVGDFAFAQVNVAKENIPEFSAFSEEGLKGDKGEEYSNKWASMILQKIAMAISLLVFPLMVISVVISGMRYILSRGDQNMIGKAKTSLIYSVIGFLVALFAYTIVYQILLIMSESTEGGGAVVQERAAVPTEKSTQQGKNPEEPTEAGKTNSGQGTIESGTVPLGQDDENQDNSKTVTIKDTDAYGRDLTKDYDIDTTTVITIQGSVLPENLSELKNLTELDAYKVVVGFSSDALALPNLTKLSADKVSTIPPTAFPNLTWLSARNAYSIPDTLTNLTYLDARSAIEIPNTLTKLTELHADKATKIPDTLTNLTKLYARSATKIPDTLTNLTYLYAYSATKIPNTLTSLTTLYANSATEIPDTLINLVVLSAPKATKIPTTLTKLKSLGTKAEFKTIDFPKLENIQDDEGNWKSVHWYKNIF